MNKEEVVEKVSESSSSSGFGFRNFAVIIVILVLLAGAVSYALIGSSKKSTSDNQKITPTPNTTAFSPISNNTIVYGNWADNSSLIKAFDLSTGKKYLLATLPINIKKVTVLSPNQLLYINKTDDKDH
ncbi:MAG: hypothetical protein M1268_03150 [Patescibacteria group bacterium]|nr:hypothetical protein [Patescibacteria group bacterium]